MRNVVIAAAVFAAGAILATTTAKAQVAYDAGGPKQIGSICRVNTDTADGGEQLDRYGYYEPCANQLAVVPSQGAGAPASVLAAASSYDSAVAYCIRRFRSYDPASGTYLGYDGRRHRCP